MGNCFVDFEGDGGAMERVPQRFLCSMVANGLLVQVDDFMVLIGDVNEFAKTRVDKWEDERDPYSSDDPELPDGNNPNNPA